MGLGGVKGHPSHSSLSEESKQGGNKTLEGRMRSKGFPVEEERREGGGQGLVKTHLMTKKASDFIRVSHIRLLEGPEANGPIIRGRGADPSIA